MSTPMHLERAVLMGGELTRSKLDLNFMSDRAAARMVVSAPMGADGADPDVCTSGLDERKRQPIRRCVQLPRRTEDGRV